MTTVVDIANKALIAAGIPKKLTSLSQDSTEAQTINAIINVMRDDLIRVAPWNCVTKYASLTYITSLPGTPENSGSGAALWQLGIPAPPWAYEYQYPIDCMRARYILPQYTSQSGGVPIFPPGTATGSAQVGWTGPALKYEVATDSFFGVISATLASGGTGHAVGDVITLGTPNFSFVQGGVTFTMPVGAPAQILVTGVTGGVITTFSLVNQVQGESSPIAGSYFSVASAVSTQGTTTGVGIGASFNLTFGPQAPQRVILTNTEFSILCYNTQIIDPNIMDIHFQDAWINMLASRLSFILNGDTPRANSLIAQANNLILEARKSDGNEGVVVNDVNPDFLRVRGNWGGPNWEYSPSMGFDWGSTYSPY